VLSKVSSVTRTVEIEITPAEAKEIVDWIGDQDDNFPSVLLQYIAPLYAVAANREFGDH